MQKHKESTGDTADRQRKAMPFVILVREAHAQDGRYVTLPLKTAVFVQMSPSLLLMGSGRGEEEKKKMRKRRTKTTTLMKFS